MAAPIIKQCEGDYTYEKYKNCLIWRLGLIDQSNSTGSLEFSVSGHPGDFFPINVSFISHKPYCDIQVRKFHSIYKCMQDKCISIFRFTRQCYRTWNEYRGLNLFHSNNLLALKMVYVDTFKLKYSFIWGAVMSRLSRVKTQNTKRNKNETNFNYFILFNINKKIISEIKIFIYTID